MFLEAIAVCALVALMVVPGWCVIDLLRSRGQLDTVPDAAPLLSAPAGILLLGLIYLVLQMSHAPVWLFQAAAVILYGAAAGWLVAAAGARKRAWDDLLHHRWPLIAVCLAAFAAVCYLAVGLERFDQIPDWTRAARRGLHNLPQDNELSWLASETWRRRLRPSALFFEIWRISDRGPLLAVVHGFLSRVFESGAPSFAAYTRVGIVLNALFVAPVAVWCSGMLSARTARVAAVLVALNPWCFLNVYYTWPKLFAASFVLAAAALLWRRGSTLSAAACVAAGMLLGLAVLAHTGTAVTLPVFWAVTVIGFARSRAGLRSALLIPILAAIVVMPWEVYKARYAPDTHNLFYMHYLDGREYFSPLDHNVGRFFAEHPPSEQISVRTNNVRELLWGTVHPGLIASFWRGTADGGALYVLEFFSPWYSAGLLWFVWTLVAFPVKIAVPKWRRARAEPSPLSTTAAVAFAAAGLILNTALRWAPAHSHELPYAETVLLAACMLVALTRAGSWWLAVAAVGVAARQVFYFTESVRVSPLRLPALDAAGMAFWATAALMLAIAVADRARPVGSQARVDDSLDRG